MTQFLAQIGRILIPIDAGNVVVQLLLAIPRIAGGLLLGVTYGSGKMGMPWTPSSEGLALFEVAPWFVQDVEKLDFAIGYAPASLAWLAAASEAIGGILLAVGLFTRIAAFMILSTMLVALTTLDWGNGPSELLPVLGFIWIAIYSLALGSGKFGADYPIVRILQ